MPKIDRLSGHSDWIELSFVERERTPRELMELGIRLYFAGLSLFEYRSRTREIRCREITEGCSRVVQKADRQPATDANPNHVAIDETVIRIDNQQYWLYAAVDPETNSIL